MEIFKHKICETEIGPPSDLGEEQCTSLPVHYEEIDTGLYAVSFWKPSPQELAELNSGHVISLWVRAPGRQHPVVGMFTFPEVL